MTRLFLLAIATCFGRLAFAADEPNLKPIPITEADSVVAILREDDRLGSRGDSHLILALWPDGRIVWSEDKLIGGAPYRAGTVDAKKVAALLMRFDKDGLFDDKKLGNAQYGPDSQFTSILIKSGKKELEMASWHELHEAYEGAVAFSAGAGGVGKSTRLQVLREDKPEYLFFRFVWSETHLKVTDLIPTESKPTNGKLVRAAGVLSWQEQPLKEKKSERKK